MRKIYEAMFSSKTRVAGGGTKIAASFRLPGRRRGEPHAWSADMEYNAESNKWSVSFDVGFVNGMDPVMPGAGPNGEDLEMWDRPSLMLDRFRMVGLDDPIPPFFKQQGVTVPAQLQNDGTGVTIDSTDRTDIEELPPRVLLAVDFYVAVARATYQSQAVVVDASGASGKIVDYAVTYDTAELDRLGDRPRFLRTLKFEEVKKPTFEERLLGGFQDEGEDRQLIATVYLMSPENVLDGPPDDAWQPFVGYETFWNLNHAQRNLPPAKPPKPITIATGLLGGLGDLIGNQILAPLNDFAQAVQAAVNTTDNSGRFWTA